MLTCHPIIIVRIAFQACNIICSRIRLSLIPCTPGRPVPGAQRGGACRAPRCGRGAGGCNGGEGVLPSRMRWIDCGQESQLSNKRYLSTMYIQAVRSGDEIVSLSVPHALMRPQRGDVEYRHRHKFEQ
eukprot:scaffold295117_cov18-Prasinocladus_malaysianus.AAC.1